jgi:hypothetical protein
MALFCAMVAQEEIFDLHTPGLKQRWNKADFFPVF